MLLLIIEARFETSIFSPEPMFIGCASVFVLKAFILASTTSDTWTKSLVCLPSPKIVRGFFCLANSMNFGIAAAYGELGSCLSPNILKYLKTVVSRSYRCENVWQ